MKKKLIFIFFLLSWVTVQAQERISNVVFEGNKKLVLQAVDSNLYVSGKLTSGDIIRSTCSGGSCSIEIEYKGRSVEVSIGDAILNLTVYEYDFSGDGDVELVVINDFMDTSYLFIFSYSRGLIEKIFQYEVSYYKTEIDENYIVYCLPSGPEGLWHYYKGYFWEMNPMKLEW